MSTKGNFTFSRAIALDVNRLKELEAILLKFSDHVTYKATNQGKKAHDYETIEDLTRGDNFGGNKVRLLDISGVSNSKNVIHIRFNCCRFCPIIYPLRLFECWYELQNEQVEASFLYEVDNFLKKATVGYWRFAKARLFNILMLAVVICGLCSTYLGWPTMPEFLTARSFASVAYRMLLLLAIYLVDSFIINPIMLKAFFPPVNFVWGEEIRFYNKRGELRKNIVWGIFADFFKGVFSRF